MSISSNNHQAGVKMRWEKQERESRWSKTGWVKARRLTVLCVCVEACVCEKVVCVKEL